MKKVVKNFDRLSDMLCGVIDAAELIRHSHPDRTWVQAANDVYDSLCSFMNYLNTDFTLYEILRDVLSDPDIAPKFTYEQKQTALVFIRDFEKSGIHLPPESRAEYVALSDEVNVLGRKFSSPGHRTSVYVRSSELDGIPTSVRQQIAHQGNFIGKIRITPGSWEALAIAKYSPNEDLRQRLHISEMQPDPTRIGALESLLRARDRLARLVGKESFAEWSLEDKMAKNSDNVLYFLKSLEAHERPLALSELSRIADAKQRHLHLRESPIVHPWDREFFSTQLQQGNSATKPDILFPSGSVFQALSRLFNSIYGVRLRPREVAPGEVWHPDVQRLDVVDESGTVIGLIYVDLWIRKGKHSGAAHYTVRCSRRIDDDDADADFLVSGALDLRQNGAAEIMQPIDPVLREGRKMYQLPIAALVCEFVPPANSKVTTGLTWYEVKTLFHEMGHAMHSMLGRTDYHNVSGTRCSTDFVELPSILMEKFLASPAVLSLFPSSPDAPIPSYPELQNYLSETNTFPSLEAHTQILMAILDQVYHSKLASRSDFSTTTELHTLQDTLGLFASVPNTAWQTHFTHLYGYGATYYTYLFCRAIARKVWKTLFERDPLNRETGERFKQEVLRYGGGKEPWEMVGALLDMPEVASGDRKAMEIVGQWGVEEKNRL
ncbi:Mitochondrial intermediate peptidase [Tulasnella sp. 403]|nr:Mitochondrial intermediate peptidase [Tulasnella sp. 403]